MIKTTRLERLGDAIVGLFSEGRQARRQHFRLMERDEEYREKFFALMSARGYRAASESSNQWMNTNTSADSEVLGSLAGLTSRSRELNRDDPIASGLTKTFVHNVIGTGMMPQAVTDSPEKNDALEEVWKERRDHLFLADDMDHAEHQRMMLHKLLEDGNIYEKPVKRRPSDPVWFETIEKDRILTPQDAKARGGGEIRDGVEKDAFGVPVAYWVCKEFPNESLLNTVAPPKFSSLSKDNFVRVDASMMIRQRLATRPGQTHGVPWFHAVMQDIRDLDLLMEASLKRVQIAACLAVFIKSPKGITNLMDATAQKYGYRLDQAIVPGMMFKLYPDESVETLIPNFPTPEFAPFVVMLARRIGAALGVSWQIVLKDFGDSTFSSARTDLLEARMVYVVLGTAFASRILTPEWRFVQMDALVRGDQRLRAAGVTAEDIDKVSWIPTGWDWIDPKNDAQATQIKMELKLTNLRDEAARHGKDWQDLVRQALLEEKFIRDMREEMGLPDLPSPEEISLGGNVQEDDDPNGPQENDEDDSENEGEDDDA